MDETKETVPVILFGNDGHAMRTFASLVLDIDHPAFHANLNRLYHCAMRADAGKADGGIVGNLKKALWSVAGAAVFVRLYFIPVKSNALPQSARLVPSW